MKKYLVSSFVATGFFLNAQTIGNSPYAAFGLGDTKYDNSVEINAMGGISTAYVSDFSSDFNFKNPATNQNLELTTIKIEGTNENNFYKSNYNNLNTTKHSSYLSNISIAFPITKKLKFGMGFQPYSSKGYDISIANKFENSENSAYNIFTGTGSVNIVQTAFSYAVSKNFNLGLRTNYLFGKVNNMQEFTSTYSELINGYKTVNKVSSFNFTLGSIYKKKLEHNRSLTLGATATLGNTGNIQSTYTNSTYYYADTQTQAGVTIVDEKTSNIKNIIPQEYSLGVGYGKDIKWFVSSQIDYKKGADFDFLGQTYANNPSYRVSLGGWYLPNVNNFRNYFSRVVYRYGAYYEKGNLHLNGYDINKYGVAFGMTLPFANSSISRFSGVNLGIELGKRGTVQNNLIRQNYFNLKIGINFADKWFNKRLYN